MEKVKISNARFKIQPGWKIHLSTSKILIWRFEPETCICVHTTEKPTKTDEITPLKFMNNVYSDFINIRFKEGGW